MSKKIIKLIPYAVLVIAICFTLYSVMVLQDIENQCNKHLKDQFEKLKNMSCEICSSHKEESNLNFNVSINIPGWAS